MAIIIELFYEWVSDDFDDVILPPIVDSDFTPSLSVLLFTPFDCSRFTVFVYRNVACEMPFEAFVVAVDY